MKASLVLQLSSLLVGLCQAHRDPPPHSASTSEETGGVPVSQLRMLSLGLAHLLHEVTESTKQMEQRGEQVSGELDGAAKSLESFRKHSLLTGRTHRQVRKDLQILSAKGDRLQRVVRDLQKGLEDLETEHGATQYWMNWIHQRVKRVKSLTEPGTGGHTQINIGSVKDIMDKQARRLASLTSEVSARDRLINRRLQHIERLEKQVSEIRLAAQRADSHSDCVQ